MINSDLQPAMWKHAIVLVLASATSVFLFGCNSEDRHSKIQCEGKLETWYDKKVKGYLEATRQIETQPKSKDNIAAFLNGRPCWQVDRDAVADDPHTSPECLRRDKDMVGKAKQDTLTANKRGGYETSEKNAIEAFKKCVEASGYNPDLDQNFKKLWHLNTPVNDGQASDAFFRVSEMRDPRAKQWDPNAEAKRQASLNNAVRHNPDEYTADFKRKPGTGGTSATVEVSVHKHQLSPKHSHHHHDGSDAQHDSSDHGHARIVPDGDDDN